MMTPECFLRLRHLYDREHLSVLQISRILDINLKTAAKWVRHERFPTVCRRERPSKLDRHKGVIAQMLTVQNLTAIQILQRLRSQGYTGGYSILKDYVSRIRPPRKPAFLTVAYAPGECAQVDWGCAGVLPVGTTKRRLSFLVVVLCYSRRMYVEFTLAEKTEHFLGALQRALLYFGAVPQSVMVDNMKTAVLRHPPGMPPVFHPRFLEFARHYGFMPKACGVRQPQAKGRVENGVGYIKKNFLNGLAFSNLAAINAAAHEWLGTVANVRIHRETGEKPAERFGKERSSLLPLNPNLFDTGVMQPIRASRQFRITVDTNRYSIPYEYAGQRLNLKLTDDHLWLYAGQKLLADHVRSYDRRRDFENPDHVRELLQQRQGAAYHKLLQRFLCLWPGAEEFYRQMDARHLNPKHHVRQIMALTEIYPSESVVQALQDAAQLGAYRSEYVANILAMRQRPATEPGPLHVTRRQDLLDIHLPLPDLSIYEKHINKENMK
ncbi:MAG: IS21 family transposase [Dehalococcoidales bacterium]|nr:IS21 family transposase [Dehalococcoidales bacterium]